MDRAKLTDEDFKNLDHILDTKEKLYEDALADYNQIKAEVLEVYFNKIRKFLQPLENAGCEVRVHYWKQDRITGYSESYRIEILDKDGHKHFQKSYHFMRRSKFALKTLKTKFDQLKKDLETEYSSRNSKEIQNFLQKEKLRLDLLNI